MAWRLQARSIHGELARFVIVLALPLAALIAYLLVDRAQHDIGDAESAVRRLADNGAERAAHFAEEARTTLEAIARRPLVRAMDPARCDPDLRHLLDLYPRAGNFLVVDREGRILCGAIPPPRGRVVRLQDQALLRDILASGRFALSAPALGRIDQRWTVAAVQPVFGGDGAVNGFVSMSIDLIDWRPIPAIVGVPGDTFVSLLSGGVVIAQSRDPGKWVGRDVSGGEIMQHVRALKTGVVRGRGVADVERIWAFRPVPGTGWTVLVGTRAAEVLGPVHARTLQAVLLVALAVAAALALALAYARRLRQPVECIAEALRLRAAGAQDLRIPVSGPREVADVAEELNRGIEERARAGQRLELAQRLFAALSEINETIVRVREREELFRQCCRICAERLGFVVAFIALVDPVLRRIVPRVYAGPGSGFLGDTTFPLEDGEPLSTGVTSLAVRGARAAVSNDADTDPGKQAARSMRQRIGSKSTAAFPLFQGGEAIGALTVHAAAVDFFDAPVVELLTRMAGDISFALDKLAEQDQLAGLTRELEDRVRRRTAELEAANQELEAFSYSVSHDLRAPLRHIDGFARLLEKELEAPGGKAGHYLATITAAARRMGVLIDDLLQLSRTGRQGLALNRVDAGAMVRELIREAAPEMRERRIEWSLGELPPVLADAALLRIVLQNLLSNAIKYSRPRPVARIGVEARAAAGGVVEIAVRDNGVGFDMRFADKLFGVFQRLHHNEDFEGTGIGLAMAQRIVHRHGQRIWGEGAPEAGATFTFTMAAAEGVHESSADTAG